MAKLIYISNTSLDGYTDDQSGAFDRAPHDNAVLALITELMQSAGTDLYGRLMYQTSAVWETDPTLATHSDPTADYARTWQATERYGSNPLL